MFVAVPGQDGPFWVILLAKVDMTTGMCVIVC